jgi:hypothetical protein
VKRCRGSTHPLEASRDREVVALIEGKAWATAALGRRLTKKELKEFAEELSNSKKEDLELGL